jgi:hypothetical protein
MNTLRFLYGLLEIALYRAFKRDASLLKSAFLVGALL